MLKISYAASPCLFQLILEQFTLEMSCRPKSPKNSQKPLFGRSRPSKVIEFSGNREPVYDFLLVINSNLGSISHHFWNTEIYWLKIANFPYPLSFNTFIQGDPLRIYGKALQFLKLESARQSTVKIWWSYLAPFLTDPPVWWRDGRTELRWLRHAKAVAAFARNNQINWNMSWVQAHRWISFNLLKQARQCWLADTVLLTNCCFSFPNGKWIDGNRRASEASIAKVPCIDNAVNNKKCRTNSHTDIY